MRVSKIRIRRNQRRRTRCSSPGMRVNFGCRRSHQSCGRIIRSMNFMTDPLSARWRSGKTRHRLVVAGMPGAPKTEKDQREGLMKIGDFLKNARQRLVICTPDDTLEALAKSLHAHSIGA